MEAEIARSGSVGNHHYHHHHHKAQPSRPLPFHAILIAGRFFRLLSVYVVYRYLRASDTSVVTFMSVSLSLSSVLFLLLQQPWRGRALSTSQLIPTVITGGILALSLVLWGLGLKDSGPIRTVLGEYAGAVLGAVSTLMFGRSDRRWRKVAGLVAMLASYFFLSQGWTFAAWSPFAFRYTPLLDDNIPEKGYIGVKSMVVPILAGILAALRRVIARRVSLKSQVKRRLHAITITSAACFLFPFLVLDLTKTKGSDMLEQHEFRTWAYTANVIFGILIAFYVDSFAEERLRISVASPKHLIVTAGCIIILELLYGMDFSLIGFMMCTCVLGLGMFEATSIDRAKAETMSAIPIHMSEIGETQYPDLPS